MSLRYEQAKQYTERYKNKLLPCAVCKSEDVRICTDRTIFPKPQNVWFVACQTPNCDCTDSFTSVKQAVARWNDMQKERQ